jgi:hypothetical protein
VAKHEQNGKNAFFERAPARRTEMTRIAGLACAIAFLLLPVNSQNERFSKYQRVEAYEVRPGILMTPRYAADGQVCEVAIQKDHYFNGTIQYDSELPREVVIQIFDELAPPAERGPQTINDELARLSLYAGASVTSFLDYKNVALDVSRPASSPGDIVAVIQWKGRSCQ